VATSYHLKLPRANPTEEPMRKGRAAVPQIMLPAMPLETPMTVAVEIPDTRLRSILVVY
jgi:hypothetical protein